MSMIALLAALALIYIAAGVISARFALIYIRPPLLRLVLASFICALFFSVGLVVGRIIVPGPTLILFIGLLYEVATKPLCTPTSEGCNPELGSQFFVFVPFLFQWAIWLGIFSGFHFRRCSATRADPDQDGA